jgi:hypothetical protein
MGHRACRAPDRSEPRRTLDPPPVESEPPLLGRASDPCPHRSRGLRGCPGRRPRPGARGGPTHRRSMAEAISRLSTTRHRRDHRATTPRRGDPPSEGSRDRPRLRAGEPFRSSTIEHSCAGSPVRCKPHHGSPSLGGIRCPARGTPGITGSSRSNSSVGTSRCHRTLSVSPRLRRRVFTRTQFTLRFPPATRDAGTDPSLANVLDRGLERSSRGFDVESTPSAIRFASEGIALEIFRHARAGRGQNATRESAS